jgi:hypothetical protein
LRVAEGVHERKSREFEREREKEREVERERVGGPIEEMQQKVEFRGLNIFNGRHAKFPKMQFGSTERKNEQSNNQT